MLLGLLAIFFIGLFCSIVPKPTGQGNLFLLVLFVLLLRLLLLLRGLFRLVLFVLLFLIALWLDDGARGHPVKNEKVVQYPG